MSTQAIHKAETLAEAVARRVRGLMGEYRITGSALSKRMGMTQQAFSRRTTGMVAFSLDELSMLARILGVSEAYLLGFENDESPRLNAEGLGRVRHQGLEPRTRWFGASPADAPVIPLPERQRLAPVVPLRRAV